MKQITLEWISKAEADFATAQREFAVETAPNYDAVCFHSQQSAEKFLKARLQEAEIPFVRTHDLTVLLDLVLVVEPEWESLRSRCTHSRRLLSSVDILESRRNWRRPEMHSTAPRPYGT